MAALENESTLPIPNNTFWTKSVFGNDVDAILGSLDTVEYPDASHPYSTAPVFLPTDPWHEWTILDQLPGQFFTVDAIAPHQLVLQQRDADGNWIGEAGSSTLGGTANADGPGDYANAISLRVGVADDDFQGNHGLGFDYSLSAKAPDADHFAFTNQFAGHAFFAEITSADFDPLLGWFADDGDLVGSNDDGGNGTLSRIAGIVPDSGEVSLAVTGAGDSAFNGQHGETGDYELSFFTTAALFPIVIENAPNGAFVVVAGGISRRPVQYTLTDDADGRFDIDSQTGLITVEDGSKIDYESSVAHEVEVTTTFLSGGTAPIVGTLTIFVRDVNEAPTAITLDNASVEENAAGAIVGVVTTEDQDIGDTHTYQSSDIRFEVVGDQLKLKDGVDLDHESEPSVTLTVTAIDEGGLSVAQSFTVSVTDVNEAPVAVDDAGVTTENAAVTIDVLANDTDVDDGDDPGTFSLDSVSIASVTGLMGGGAGVVSIDGNQLRFDPGSDFDELDEGDTAIVVVDYIMSDDEGVGAAAQATITVTGVNDAPVVVDVTAAAVEDGPAVTGSFLGDDVDADDDGTTLTYTITSLPSEGVVVDIDNQIFTFDPEADFQDLGEGETRDVTFGYRATDSNGAVSNGATVTITVTGVNDAPTVDVNTGKTVSEGNVELLSVSELSASDPDDTDAEIVYTVTTAPAHGHLALSDDQGAAITEFTQEDLATARVVYVHDGGEDASDSFIFDVDDPDGAGPESQLFDITLVPVNDAPTLDVNALIIQEGETKLIGPETLGASDPDTDPEDLTFTIGDLVAGQFERVSAPGIAIDEFTQAELDGALIQFVHDGGEQPPAYTVTLSDGQETVGPFPADVSFEGVNDAPVVEDVAASAVEDGAAVTASFVGDDVDSDDDGTTLTYAITSSPAEGGVADNGDGTFTFDPGADFQDLAAGETRDVTFDYTATDSHGAVSNVGVVTVTVTGVNDAPMNLSLSNNRVSENASNGTIVGTIWATDSDTADGFEYELTDDAGGAFDIDPITGRLTVDNPVMLDFENPVFEGIYSIEVLVTDPGDGTYTERMDIVLTDFNEAPTGIESSGTEVLPNPANGTVVATLSTMDPDITAWSPVPEAFTYALLDNARGRFTLDDDEIVVADGARIETGNAYELLVRSTDKGGLSVDQVLIISANPPPPPFSAIPTQGEVSQFAGDDAFLADGLPPGDLDAENILI